MDMLDAERLARLGCLENGYRTVRVRHLPGRNVDSSRFTIEFFPGTMQLVLRYATAGSVDPEVWEPGVYTQAVDLDKVEIVFNQPEGSARVTGAVDWFFETEPGDHWKKLILRMAENYVRIISRSLNPVQVLNDKWDPASHMLNGLIEKLLRERRVAFLAFHGEADSGRETAEHFSYYSNSDLVDMTAEKLEDLQSGKNESGWQLVNMPSGRTGFRHAIYWRQIPQKN